MRDVQSWLASAGGDVIEASPGVVDRLSECSRTEREILREIAEARCGGQSGAKRVSEQSDLEELWLSQAGIHWDRTGPLHDMARVWAILQITDVRPGAAVEALLTQLEARERLFAETEALQQKVAALRLENEQSEETPDPLSSTSELEAYLKLHSEASERAEIRYLKKKAAEYEGRCDAHEAQLTLVGAYDPDARQLRTELRRESREHERQMRLQLEKEIAELELAAGPLCGLPPNVDEARKLVESASDELRLLDAEFSRLVAKMQSS